MQAALGFLKDLSKNNNREWFHEHKKRYEQELKKPFENLIAQLIEAVQEVDSTLLLLPKQAIFRIHRDTRFSKDKTPYKTHVSAIIVPGGTKNKETPGFYMQLEPGMLMLGGGAYFLEGASLYKMRQFIMQNLEDFNKVIHYPDFITKYETLQGERNKRLPPEFAEAATAQPLLYNKQFYYMAELDPQHIFRTDVIHFIIEYYHAAKPVHDFLVAALRN
mgnify:FL=1